MGVTDGVIVGTYVGNTLRQTVSKLNTERCNEYG